MTRGGAGNGRAAGMRTERQRRARGRQGVAAAARPTPADMPSLAGATSPPAAPRSSRNRHQQVISARSRSHLLQPKRGPILQHLRPYSLQSCLSAIARFEESCFFVANVRPPAAPASSPATVKTATSSERVL